MLGGVLTWHIRYENPKPAVNKVLRRPHRIESQRWTVFRSRYGFDAFYCIPVSPPRRSNGSVRLQRILTMRFYDHMTQTEIAAVVGLSQMRVSRLLRRSLGPATGRNARRRLTCA